MASPNAPITTGNSFAITTNADPTALDSSYPTYTLWFNTANGNLWVITNNTSGAAIWIPYALQPMARAWVNFVGSSGTINSSFNVTSVTRNSTGNYTVNFTTAMNNANYSPHVSTTGSAPLNSFGTLTTTTAVITTFNIIAGALGSISSIDPTSVSVVFFD